MASSFGRGDVLRHRLSGRRAVVLRMIDAQAIRLDFGDGSHATYNKDDVGMIYDRVGLIDQWDHGTHATNGNEEAGDDGDNRDQLRVQLAACLTAAEGGIADPAKLGDYGWSPAYQKVLDLRRHYETLLNRPPSPAVILGNGDDAVVDWEAVKVTEKREDVEKKFNLPKGSLTLPGVETAQTLGFPPANEDPLMPRRFYWDYNRGRPGEDKGIGAFFPGSTIEQERYVVRGQIMPSLNGTEYRIIQWIDAEVHSRG